MDDPRTVFRIEGADALPFLQDLVTNDVEKLSDGLVYAALLTPQGKYRADFLLVPQDDGVLLDVATPVADGLVQALNMYRLRRDVRITPTEIAVTRGLGPAPEAAFADPRDPRMGWRGYDGQPGDDTDWTAQRIEAVVPQSGVELTSDSFILEMGFERLNGVDFRKGCYVGQEIAARMKHKTELRKGLARVRIEGEAPAGTEIMSDGKVAGKLFSQSGGHALAHLRFDRAGADMQAGDATVHWDG